jgi:predicted ribosomally synthesized peptide with SipW-like signal peptide
MHRARATILLLLGIAGTLAAWNSKEEAFIGSRRNWWAFQKPVRAQVPDAKDSWVKTPIDAFLLQAMTEKKLRPSPALDRNHLIRRVTLDLTGLPATPEQVDAFVRDRSPNAYEKVVDRLLASPQYGERWALKWLDVVRYADTNGYELDAVRTHAWRYRDYVVAAFNADKPYDRFVKEQLAGDELYPNNDEALIATGFHRAGPIHLVSGNQDEEMNRQEVLTEYANGVASVFLGLTVGCAKCHNHKFDPILQADYYRLQAVFGATQGKDVVIATAEERAAYEKAHHEYEVKLKSIEDRIKDIEKPYRERITAEKKTKLEPKLLEALAIPKDKRTPEQQVLAKNAQVQTSATWDEVVATLTTADRDARAVLRRKMHELELTEPEPPRTAYAVQNEGSADDTHILKVGDPHQKLERVTPGFPTVLAPDNGNVTIDACSRRTALANWLASPEHPLTARVMVNRIWQFRMGRGLVRTPNDFGRLGERPTNPQLLDWLATEFVAKKWSVKAIDRMIVLSSAYQQASADDEAKAQIDPENKLYWRAHQRRLEGEAIRDCALAVSGELNPKMGGRPVRVPIEKEVYDLIFSEDEPDNLWPLVPDTREYNRRTIYLLNKRTVRLPMLLNFDQPDNMTSCPVRPTSTHALQALSLINSDFMHQQSIAFAKRLDGDCGTGRDCKVRRAYQLALARTPKQSEVKMARDFFARGGLMEDFCLALLNRNEFVYVP